MSQNQHHDVGEGESGTDNPTTVEVANSVYRSHPPEQAHLTTAPNRSNGVYELPLFESVMSHARAGTVPNNDDEEPWARHDLQQDSTANVGLTSGDVLSYPPQHAFDTRLADVSPFYVVGVTPTEARLESVITGEEHSVEKQPLIEEIEYGCVEKITTLSSAEYEYIHGDFATDPITEKFADPSPRGTVDDLVLTVEADPTTKSKFFNHPVVGHVLGLNHNMDYITLGARYGGKDGSIAALVTLRNPVAAELDSSQTVQIGRFASHPFRPENTGSWLLSRAVTWAKLEGYTQMISYAGVGGNQGAIYRSLGFSNENYDATNADGDGWTNRGGRSGWADYNRDRYDYSLFDTEAPLHRRKREPLAAGSVTPSAATQRPASQQGFEEYDVTVYDSTVPVIDAETASNKSLANPSSELYYTRRDDDAAQMKSVIARYGNQTRSAIDDVSPDVVFAAVAPEGVVAAMCVTLNTDSEAEIVAYGEVSTPTDTNTAAILLARVREWSGLNGYEQTIVTPERGSELQTAAKQCGFSELHPR